MDVTFVRDHMPVRHGLPRPDWNRIILGVEQLAGDRRDDDAWLHETWTSIARSWLEALREALPNYVVKESPQFLLLVAADDRRGDTLLRWAEHYRRSVLQILGDVGCEEGYGKHVLLAFDNREPFYSYICDFYPEEGEFADAGGIFLDHGYGHIALWTTGQYDLERTIAHELTHNLLRHLPLPLWLNEGVTQYVSDAAVGSSSFAMSSDLARRHRAYWNQSTIDNFWSGQSFTSPDDGQELSYNLAKVLFRNLNGDFSRRVRDFIRSANFADAGEQALVDTCGVRLEDRVVQFLGPGHWKPRNDYGTER